MKIFTFATLILWLVTPGQASIEIQGKTSPRIQYAADQLNKALAGILQPESPTRIILSSDKLEKVEGKRTPEGYHLFREVDGTYRIQGFGDY